MSNIPEYEWVMKEIDGHPMLVKQHKQSKGPSAREVGWTLLIVLGAIAFFFSCYGSASFLN